MKTAEVQFGIAVKDRITRFEGILTGFASYISGCAQGLVAPQVRADGSPSEAHWFDLQRLDVVPGTVIVLDNTETPGADKPAPVR